MKRKFTCQEYFDLHGPAGVSDRPHQIKAGQELRPHPASFNPNSLQSIDLESQRQFIDEQIIVLNLIGAAGVLTFKPFPRE